MADRRAVIPAQARSQEIELDQKFVPIVLAGNDDHDLSILTEYAEFWKVPYTLRSQIDQNRSFSHLVRGKKSTRETLGR